MRNIVRKDTGEGYNAMLERMGKESGIKTPSCGTASESEGKNR